jgi:hypothetical protein
MYDIIDRCLKLDHLARPQTAFELQKALMRDVQAGADAMPLNSADHSFAGRLKKTLNRKIF